jgi:hypothetical protein
VECKKTVPRRKWSEIGSVSHRRDGLWEENRNYVILNIKEKIAKPPTQKSVFFAITSVTCYLLGLDALTEGWEG